MKLSSGAASLTLLLLLHCCQFILNLQVSSSQQILSFIMCLSCVSTRCHMEKKTLLYGHMYELEIRKKKQLPCISLSNYLPDVWNQRCIKRMLHLGTMGNLPRYDCWKVISGNLYGCITLWSVDRATKTHMQAVRWMVDVLLVVNCVLTEDVGKLELMRSHEVCSWKEKTWASAPAQSFSR